MSEIREMIKISELIEELEKAKKKVGDVEVKIKYADDGGYYSGDGKYLGMEIHEDKIVLLPD